MDAKLKAGIIIEEHIEIPTETENIGENIKGILYAGIKRLFDILASVIGIILLLPLYCIVAVLIKKEDGGPVFFRQERVGKNGKLFYIYKFRSMKINAQELDKMLTSEQLEQYYREYKLECDPRITNIGNFIRKSSIDELPQLVNILKGDMSIVGPRPVLMRETHLFGEERSKLLSVRPGLTGYWQVYARNDADYKSGSRQKMEIYYIDNKSVFLDVKIIFKTFGAVVRKTGM